MEEEREERRKEMSQRKQSRKAQSARLLAAGNPGDVDFIGMVEEWRAEQACKQKQSNQKSSSRNSNIIVAVRKRPMFVKEREKLDHDSVSCYHPKVWIHSAKFKVDGITKYLTHTGFQFDHAFGEESTTDQIYVASTLPLVDHVVRTRGRATVFCYGQTGMYYHYVTRHLFVYCSFSHLTPSHTNRIWKNTHDDWNPANLSS